MGLFVMSKRRVGVPIPETIAVCTASFRCCRKDCISQLVHGRVWLALFQCDHYPICADAEGPAPPWNLVPRLIRAHRRKTAKRDLPEVAKDQAGYVGGSGIRGPPSRQGSRRAAPREPLAQEIICKAEDQK